jgi:hypothetical protein
MMQSIAIEFLSNKYLSRQEQKLMNHTDFKRIKDGLCAALDASAMADGDKLHVWKVVRESNRLPLRGKIIKLIAKWSVPMIDISSETVSNIVKVRNAIAHGKILFEDRDTRNIDRAELMLQWRELMTRMIFVRIAYNGTYISYLGGQHPRLSPSFARQ